MLKINMRSVKGIVSSFTVNTETEQTTTIKVPHQGAFNIELIDSATGHAPQMVMTKRVGNNLLLVIGEDDFEHPDVVLEEYYDNDNVHLVGPGENGYYYEYIPTSGDVAEYTPALTEGKSGELVLGDAGYPSADPLAGNDHSFGWLPFLLLGGAAGAAGIAIAASQGGGGGDDAEPTKLTVTLNPHTDLDNDGRPEFSGTSNSPHSQIVIQLPDGTQIETQTDSEGNWSIEAPSSQPNGTITVTVIDDAGNSASLTDEYIDSTPPDAAIIDINTDEQMAGRAEPGATVIITDGETGETVTVNVDENGDWSIQPNPVNEGDSDVTVVVVDPAGNISPPTDASRPDTTAPDNITSGVIIDSITLTDDVGSITGEIVDGGVTDDARPTFSGQATSDIDHVNIYDNGELIGTATVDESGRWSWTPEQDLVDGSTHDLNVSAVDAAGNEGPTASGTADGGWSFTVDTSTPAPVVNTNTEEELAGTAEPGAVVVVTDPASDTVASTVADADGNWSIQPNPAGVDAENVEVTATDEAGNSSTIIINGPADGTPPDNIDSGIIIDSISLIDDVGPITGEIPDGGVTDDARPTFSGQATADIDHVNIYDNGSLVGTATVDENGHWSWTPDEELADNSSHDLAVSAVDAAGNEGPRASGTADDGWSFTVDTSAPDNQTSGIVIDSISLIDDVGTITGPIPDGGVTDDARPTYSGQATADIDHVNIYDNNELIATATVDESGRWSWTPDEDLTDGSSHDLAVSAVDAAGNEGPQASGTADEGWSFTVDTTAPDNQTSGIVIDSISLLDDVGPVTGPIPDGGVTDDARPTYSGQATADIDHVNIYDAGQLVGSAAVDVDGSWSWTPESALASGAHALTVSAVDAAGNEGPQVSGTDDEAWDFSVLTSAPAQPSIENVYDDYSQGEDPDTGFLQKNQATNDATPTVNGTAGAGLTVVIWATDAAGTKVSVGEAVADDKGRWSITTSALGADGVYDLSATAVNAAGVSSAETGPFRIVLDTTNPEAASAMLTDAQGDVTGTIEEGSLTDDRSPLLSGTAEPGATVTVYLDGAAAGSITADATSGSWSLALGPLADGEHSWQVKVTDAAGNETRGTSSTFTVDSSSVALTIDQANDNVGSITGPVANGGLTDDATPELQGTTSPGAVVTVRDAAGDVLGSSTADAQGIWTFQLAELADGEHSFTAEVTSAAGNRSEASFTLNVDATAPVKPVITSMLDDVGTIQGVATESGGVTDDPAPTFSGTAEKGALVTLYDNGALLGSVKADDVDGSWSYTPTTNLVEGDHSITATATDAAGNVSAISDSWPFELDISTPAPDITTNTEAELAGTAEAGAVIVVTDPTTGSVASTVADADGNWSIQPNPAEVDAKNVEVVATDEAGNSSSIIIDGPADGTPPDNIDSGIIIDSITLIDDVGTITGPIPDGGVTDDARPTYSGQATADIDHVNIYDNGSLIATATVDENGRWSWTPDEDLADGSAHDLAVSAVDAAGNEGPKASGTADEGWSFTVDTTAPDNQTSGIVIDSISLIDDVGPVTGPIPDGGVTDDARPTYSGQATADIDHVNIYDNGSLIATAAVDVDGRWSWTPESALASGAHALTVSAVDAAGNEGPQVSGTDDEAWDFTLLTSAPAEPSIENVYDDYSQGEDPDTGYLQKNQATNDSTLTLNGSAGQEVTVIIWATDAAGNRVNVGEGRTDANGQWSITTTALGADGVYDLSATAVNAAGVSSTETGPFRIVLDTTPPEAAAAKLTDAEGDVQGTIEEGSVTDDRSPLLSGTAEPGTTVTVYLDGAAAGSVTADATDGSWSLALGPLADGDHSWQVKVTDAAGNETRGTSSTFTVDSSSVALTIDQANDNVGSITGPVANGGLTDDATPELQGTTSPGAVVTVRDAAGDVLGSSTANAQGIWTFQLAELADGEHSFTAEVTSAAGIRSEASFTLTVDTTAPAAPVIVSLIDDVGLFQGTQSESGGITDDPVPTFSGTAEKGALVALYDNGVLLASVRADAESGSWSYTPTTNLVDGTHSMTATATDAAGNVSVPGDAWTFTLDTSTMAPEIATNSEETLAGRAEAGAVIVVTDPTTGTVTSTVADADGNWSIQPNPAAVDAENVVVQATDEAGNRNSTIISGPADSTPPDNIDSGIIIDSISLIDDVGTITGPIPDGGVTDDARPTYSGQATADIDHVIIYDNGAPIGSAAVDESGRWSWTPDEDLADGSSHDLTVSAVDAAGNEGPQASGTADDGWSFTVDTSAPDNQTSGIVIDSISLLDDVGPVTGPIPDGGVTDDARPTYSGQATADIDHVNIYDAGQLVGSAAVDVDGSWSWTPESALASGAHALTVSAVDAAGNEGPQVSGTDDEAWDFSVLTSAPAQPSIENVYDDYSQGEDPDTGFLQKNQATNDATPTVNGTAGAGLTVVIWATDAAGTRVSVGEAVADDKGRWSITTSALGADGVYDLSATAVNAAGVSSAETGPFRIVLDTTNPEAAIATLQDAQGDVTGTIEEGAITDDRSPLLSGTAEPGATVTVYLDGAAAGSVTADATDGSWSLALGPLADGDHSWQVKVTDAAGNETRGTSSTFTVDSSSVALTIDQANDNVGSITGPVANGGLTDDATPELQGTTSPGAVVTVRDAAGTVLGSSTADAQGIWTFQLAELADGEHSFTAEVTSAAGNRSEATFSLNIDTTPPEPVVIQQLQDDVGTVQFTASVAGNVTDDPAPTFSGTAEKGALVTLYDNGVLLATVKADDVDGSWSYTPTTNLLEGTHGITATATDAAGNVSALSDSWNFILDITAPNVGISKNSEESLSGVTEPGVIVVVIDKNGSEYRTTADQQGNWVIAPNPIAAGESGQIYAIDPAGNQGEALAFQGSALASYDLLNESAQVNSTTAGDQLNPSTVRLADGRIVVTWQGAGVSGTEVYMQLYEADGVHKIGTEQQVNQRTSNNQDSPQVIALADGGFLIVYESYNNGLDKDNDGVMARRYGSDGQAVTDEFQVNTTYSGAQNRPGAMATADGGYVISWESQGTSIVQRSYDADNNPTSAEVTVATGSSMGASGGPEMAAFTDAAHAGMYITVWNAASGPGDTSSTGVVGQVFAADGTPLGGSVQINTTTDSAQNYPDVITLSDGSVVVFWDSSDSGANGSDIRAVHYRVDATTGALTLAGSGDFIVNSYTSGKQYKPVGVALEDGGYLLIWGSEGGDGSGSAIYAQRFDANDNRVGREFLVNTTTSGNQGSGGDSVDATHILDAALTADGGVYVTWQSDNVDGSGTGIEGIVIDVDAAFYSEYAVNSTTAGDQTVSSVASLPDGGAVVVWQSASGDGSGSCIRAQLLDAKGEPVGAEFTVNATTAGDQLTPQVAVLADGTVQVVWSTDSGAHIKGQGLTYSYDAAGNVSGLAASGSEYSVDSSTAASKMRVPVIAALEDGGYLVVWEASLSGSWVVYGRQYDADGTPVTGETVLATTGLNANALIAEWEPLPSVAVLENGQVAVTYAIKATGYDVGVSVYDPSAHLVSSSFVANQTLTGNQASSAVSALDNGNYVVTWDSNDTSGPDQSGYGVWGRIYAADGTALTDEFLINTATAGDQHMARVVSRPDGSFVAVFLSATDTAPGAGTSGIYAQYFDAAGNKVGQQMQINQLTYGEQVEVDATFLAGGQLYVTWTDKGVGDGDGSAIKGRLVDLNETLGLTAETGATHIAYQPAQYDLNGTDGSDILDARGASSVDAKEGDDTIVINSTSFTSINGGSGYDTLVWDSNNDFDIGAVSAKVSGIEAIHMGNNTAQTLIISASDVLDLTSENGEQANTLRITGDVESENLNKAIDTVNIGKSEWSVSSAQTENGVQYDVYVNNDDNTVRLLIQQGMNVI